MNRALIYSLFLFLAGCYYVGKNSYRDVIEHPSAEWSGPECLTVIMGAANHNLLDNRTVFKVIATPYYPSVVKAIGRRAQELYHWDNGTFIKYVDRLLFQSAGMFIDWERPGEHVYDRSMRPVKSPAQFDSLMFLLTFQVRGWSSRVLSIQVPVPGAGDEYANVIPLYGPDSSTPGTFPLKEGTILLVNERGESITPKMVWGKRMSNLTNSEESIFVKFDLRGRERHFLEDSRNMFLTLKGFENEIRLAFNTGLMR